MHLNIKTPLNRFTIFLLVLFMCSCNYLENKSDSNQTKLTSIDQSGYQIGQYVTSITEGSHGQLWFGTLAKGIAQYDGNTLSYLTKKDGLPSNRVTGIIEGKNDNLWFKTGAGISLYDGVHFTNFSVAEDFLSNLVSQIFIDSKDQFWLGTWAGVYTFDGEKFKPFPLPYPDVSTRINEDTKDWITQIIEDDEGNIWFGRDGYGLCKYDGASFSHVLKKDGLNSNNITEVEIDQDGNFWIGTRVNQTDHPDPLKRIGTGGINKMTNNEILSFPEIKAFSLDDVHALYKDPSNNIWIGTKASGVYKYDGEKFTNFEVPISVMDILLDKKDNLWMAGAGGLYRMSPQGEIRNITSNGPWN